MPRSRSDSVRLGQSVAQQRLEEHAGKRQRAAGDEREQHSRKPGQKENFVVGGERMNARTHIDVRATRSEAPPPPPPLPAGP